MDTRIPIVTAIGQGRVRGVSGHWNWVVRTSPKYTKGFTEIDHSKEKETTESCLRILSRLSLTYFNAEHQTTKDTGTINAGLQILCIINKLAAATMDLTRSHPASFGLLLSRSMHPFSYYSQLTSDTILRDLVIFTAMVLDKVKETSWAYLGKDTMPELREDSVHLAKLAEQAERYEEMVENMKRVASSDQELTLLISLPPRSHSIS
ncbi:hypothetical protein EDB85DRAFT_2222930 [Lactarius pseudohatsudake]|nr:hypothetical protein EDB85DRAFT_2222930 [Lactarius pseudohatsudake]